MLTFEEGTSAAWLYTLLKPHVTRVLICDPRKNALLKVGNKSDRIDSRKLAELLRSNLLRPVFHEDTGLRSAKGTGAQLFDDHQRCHCILFDFEAGRSFREPQSLTFEQQSQRTFIHDVGAASESNFPTRSMDMATVMASVHPL
jgi:hypothetical protein